MRLLKVVLTLITLTALLMIQEGGTMAQPSKALKGSIPPIDKNIPTQIETATFALG